MEVYIKPFTLFEINRQWFLFKIRSLMHHAVLREDVDTLLKIKDQSVLQANDSLMTILKRYRLIAENEWNAKEELKRLISTYKSHHQNHAISTMELFVAQSCNMACRYCYGSDGSYHQAGIMDIATAKQSIDWLYMHTDDPEKATIVFFGGEPLMNYPVIRQSIEYAEAKFGEGKISYGMTTNMTLLTDEYLDFFATLPKFKLLVSFDGPRELQNYQRPLLDGRDSYDICTERIKAALQRGVFCTGRATVYADTDRKAVVNEMKKLGLPIWQLTPASGCAADDIKRDNTSRLHKMWIENMPKQIVQFIDAIKQRDKQTADSLMEDDDLRKIILAGVSGAKITRNFPGCSAGHKQVAISATGDVYPCHRFVGMPDFCFGNLLENNLQEDLLQEGWHEFHSSLIERNPSCADCFLRYSCSGECYYQCYSDGPQKSIYSIPDYFCDSVKMHTMLEIYVCHMLNAEDKRWYFTRQYVQSN